MKSTVLAERVETIYVVGSGEQGPAGPPGPIGPTGGSALSVVAATALGGHRMVVLDGNGQAVYASNDQLSHFHKVLGMTLGAVNALEAVDVMRGGEVTEPSWNWLLGAPVFLSTNGLLTQTAPTSGFSLIVGFPVTTTKLFVSLREPVFPS